MISRKKIKGVVFLPDYFCNQALMPLRLLPVRLVFYPVTEHLNPDWPLIDDLVFQHGSPDVFLLVHYFGFPGEITKAIRFCQQVGSVLLEDGAHVLVPFGEIGKHSWTTVFSPYKLLPVPKLGILVASEKMEISQEIFGKRKRVDINTCRWIGKRLAQSFLARCKIPWRIRKGVPFELDVETKFEENFSINAWVLQLLKVFESKLEYYKTMRRTYYKIIEEQILSINSNSDVVRPLFPFLPDAVCPYLFPIRLNENIVKHVYYRLNEMGIPAQSWPDLPPEVKENPLKHNIAIKLRASILTLPVHQSLTKDQIEYIGRSLREAILK
ncbi:MAG TPA: hypothetical protein ACFYD0_09305 [Candidatus Wunengus sp. YC65]|uniref:hypothetical protein n=1 Tax=Candidatus Wunengus sp. YC65 TaxID=3367701 RepID=UPI0040299901